MDFNQNVVVGHRSGWFSEARMARYVTASNPVSLYAWDVRLGRGEGRPRGSRVDSVGIPCHRTASRKAQDTRIRL